jgi:hypothetical protein
MLRQGMGKELPPPQKKTPIQSRKLKYGNLMSIQTNYILVCVCAIVSKS